MQVRAAVPDDAEAIASAHVRAWQIGYGHVFPAQKLAAIDEARRAEQWREGIESGWRTFVTDPVVGFSSVGPARDADRPGAGELYAIYVTPDHWGTGAGRALMERALADLREAGYTEAALWVLEDNPRARRFYEAGGWVLDGAVKEEEFLGTPARVVRYGISLR